MKKRIPTVRRLFAGVATVGLTAGLAAVFMATPAGATISSPANGSALTGVATFSATGTANTGACALLGDESSTSLQLETSASTVIDSSSASESYGNESAAATSFTFPTYEEPNGTYKVVDTEKYYTGTFCSHDTNSYTNTVDVREHDLDDVYRGDQWGPGADGRSVGEPQHERHQHAGGTVGHLLALGRELRQHHHERVGRRRARR